MGYPQTTFAATTVDPEGLIGRRRSAVIAHTLRYQLDVLKSTGRYDAFKLKWHPVYDHVPEVWPIPDHLFWDSDVAKWIEGACYFLRQHLLPDIDAAVHELVDMIATAQQVDGYLNIHYTVVAPGKRFTNLKDMHELYNAGHLIEAALAHQDLYKNDKLMDPMLKYVDLIARTFGPNDDQIHGYPGHPEIELALLRLYDRTGDPKHLSLARYFLTERGNATGVEGKHFFDWEAAKRGDDLQFRPVFYPEPRCHWYHQAQSPIVEQKEIEGHSVRAVYLLTAYSDLLRLDHLPENAEEYSAARALWGNMVQRKMYVTGGIGAIRQWEGFGPEFFLPQSLDDGGCYSETCAAIGVMMWAQRQLSVRLEGHIGDIMELCLYNAVLTSMSHNGKAFTYHNQLASSDSDLDKRSEWFTVACCPPNIMRLLGQIGGYIWNYDEKTIDSNGIAIHLFVPSTLRLTGSYENTSISQETSWPWKDTIDFTVNGSSSFPLKIRIPGWASQYELTPSCPEAKVSDGYLTIPSDWLSATKKFSLRIPLTPRWVSPPVMSGQETVALARGPVIYCAEDIDNSWVQDHFKNTFVDTSATVTEKAVSEASSDESWVSLTVKDGARCIVQSKEENSPFMERAQLRQQLKEAKLLPELNFVPYGLRSNRGGRGHMRVGFKEYNP